MEVNDKLSHLSPEEIAILVERYYSGEKVAGLIREYAIDARPSNLVSLFPPIVCENLFCPYCEDTNLFKKPASRSYGMHGGTPQCLVCSHKDNDWCNCQNCKDFESKQRQMKEERRTLIIEQEFARECEAPPPDSLSLKEAVLLLSLARHSLSEDMLYVSPFEKAQVPFAPLFDFQNELIQHLDAKGLVIVSTDSTSDCFVFNDNETTITAYYPTRVTWEFLPGLDAIEKRDFLKTLEAMIKDDDWPESWSNDIAELWHQIAKHECLEYFLYLLEQRNFKIDKVGDKTHATFENLLEDFSVSKIFNLSWMAVRDTTDYIVKENIPQYRGKNIFIGAIQRKADRAKAEKWDVKHSRRDYNCPQSVVSATFANLFLGLGDKAFETIPSKL